MRGSWSERRPEHPGKRLPLLINLERPGFVLHSHAPSPPGWSAPHLAPEFPHNEMMNCGSLVAKCHMARPRKLGPREDGRRDDLKEPIAAIVLPDDADLENLARHRKMLEEGLQRRLRILRQLPDQFVLPESRPGGPRGSQIVKLTLGVGGTGSPSRRPSPYANAGHGRSSSMGCVPSTTELRR